MYVIAMPLTRSQHPFVITHLITSVKNNTEDITSSPLYDIFFYQIYLSILSGINYSLLAVFTLIKFLSTQYANENA